MELIEKIPSEENIKEAIKRVKSNKGAPGVDKMTVNEIDGYFNEHEEEIKSAIMEMKYKPQPVRRVYIPKANGKKRPLGIPTVTDRVIQQMIAQQLNLIYESTYSNHSYGFRRERDCHGAIEEVLHYLNDGYEWVIDLDAYGIIGLNSKGSANKGFLKLSPILFSPQMRLMIDLRRKHAQNEDLSAKRSAACNSGSTVSDVVPSRLLQRQSAEHTPDVDLHRSTVRYSKDVSLACAA